MKRKLNGSHWALASLMAVASACGNTEPGAGGLAGSGTSNGASGGHASAGAADALAGEPGLAGGAAQGGASPSAAGAGSEAGGEVDLRSAAGDSAEQLDRPNFVLILTDDTGWNGTSVQMLKLRADSKSDYYETPNIARLSAMGTENLDTAIGRVLDTLRDPNGDGDDADSLLATTYILLLSDNGAVDTISDNAPLAAGKATTYEGGMRVPFFVAGPGIAAGARSNVPVTEYDILPTIADWAGATPAPKGGALDGGSFAQLTRGTSTTVQGRGSALVGHFPHYQVEKGSKPMSSIRDGNLKLVHFYEAGDDHLYNLANDLGETTDLAQQQPADVRRLRHQLRDYLKSVAAPMPRLNPDFGKGTFPDVDQDGLNDDWEFRELLTTAYSGTDDPDGDGQTNAQEFAKKTDPLP